MSLLPLTVLPGLAVSMLSIAVAVQDVAYTLNAITGIDEQGAATNRTLQAVVEVNGVRLEKIFGGSVSDGDLGIVTTGTLYFNDLFAPGATRTQSFVTHQGVQYRVAEVADWSLQTGTKIYLAKRHVPQAAV